MLCAPSALAGNVYQPRVSPANFGGPIDNPYMPLTPGTAFVYEGVVEGQALRNVVVVTRQTKVILGVRCVVVQDTVTVDDELTERTEDWYAQDRRGAVWYFGEASHDYEDGVLVSTEGSWQAGVDGAQPGVVMEAHPQVGDTYRQEYLAGVAEDFAQVLSLNESSSVPYGSFQRVVETSEWTPLEPGVVEHKYYARGVGLLSSVMVEGGQEHMELVAIQPARGR